MTALDAHKLTVYFGERDRAGRRALWQEVMGIFDEADLSASVLMRGTEGFGRRHSQRTQRLLTLSEDLPLVAVGVDRPERIGPCHERVLVACGDRGLVTLERARLRAVAAAGEVALDDEHDECKLTIYWGRGERAGAQPAYRAMVGALRASGVSGATVLLGVDGTIRGRRSRARMLGANAGVPLIVVAVGARATVQRGWQAVRDVLGADPPATIERVSIIGRDGASLGGLPSIAATATAGDRLKLTVFAGEQARHDGRPQYVELMRRMRAEGARGATSLRGVWGFHGDHAPHGDSLWSVRRRVPVVTVVVEEPGRAAELYARVIAPVTDEAGLVTCETVPYDLAP